MSDETPYIKPNLRLSVSFQELLDTYRQYGRYFYWVHDDKQVTLDGILKQKLVFVVGEPGQGKTRLLTELQKLAPSQAVTLNLKTRGREETIENLVKAQVPDWESDESSIVFLDGLDEVAQTDILYAIRHIKDYIRRNPTSTIIISSRLHYFAQYETQFIDLTQAKYVMVDPLELSQARRFLISLGISEATVETVIKSLRFKREDPLVVQNPRYLEFLAQFIKANPAVTKNINRATIFGNFVDNALKAEDTKNGTSLKQIKRRFLERLALTMEIAQVNTITEREFTTFLDNAKSDAKLALLSQTTVDDLYVHSLLKKDKDDRVSFDNAEMQEYLAAKAILDMKDKWHVVFDLTIDPNLRELYPSWENTVSFLIDEMPELLPELANLKDNPDSLAVNESWYQLLTGSTSLKLTDPYKKDIFERVIRYYLDHNVRMLEEIAFNLANYMLSNQLPPMIDIANAEAGDKAAKIRLINVVRIIGYAASLNKLTPTQRAAMRKRFIDLALKSDDTSVQREVIDALGGFKDDSVVVELMPLAANKDPLVIDSLQALAIELNRNSSEAVQIFIAGMKSDRSRFGRHGLLGVDSADGIKRALEALASDKDILSPLIKHNSTFTDEENSFLSAIDAQWQDAWLVPLKQIISNSIEVEYGYYAVRSAFIAKAIKLIGEKDPSFFGELLRETSDKKRILADEMSHALAEIMRIDDIAVIVKAIKEVEPDQMEWWLFAILRVLPNSDNPNAAELEREARVQLPDMYKEYDKAVKKAQKDSVRNPALDNLKKHVAKAHEGTLQSVAEAMQDLTRDSRNGLLEATPEDDLEFLWTEAKEKFLDPYDPADTEVTITKRSADGARSYNISWFINIFSLSVEYGVKTRRSGVTTYRSKLINLIPFAYDDSLEAVFKTVGEMTPGEQKRLVDTYSDLESDKAQLMLSNLMTVAEKYNVELAAPVLDKVVDLKNTTIWNREKALELAQFFNPDTVRLQEIFDTYIKDDECKPLSLKANSLLITKHADEKALRWLVKYVQDNAFKFVQPMEAHAVGFKEDELHDGKIISALKSVKDPKHIGLYLGLWETGAELMAKGAAWESYASYLWDTVDQYFSNLIVDADYEPLKKLEEYANNYNDKVAAARYVHRLNALKRSYLDAVGRPAVFADAVNKHNELISKDYVAINSEHKLFEDVHKALDTDWRAWVTQEGRQFVLEKREQKNIYQEIQLILLRKDFPAAGLRVLREAQEIDNTATDYLVYYNFYGPVVIELKRSGHGDLKAKKLETQTSYKSMEKYMRQYSAQNGILLVYDDEDMSDAGWETFVTRLKATYEKIPGVTVVAVRVAKS